jgi:hypothetical protein
LQDRIVAPKTDPEIVKRIREKLQSVNALLDFNHCHDMRKPPKSDCEIMIIAFILLLQAVIGALVVFGLVMELREWQLPWKNLQGRRRL